MFAAGQCRRIWARVQRDKTFPYALGDFGSTFDDRGGLVLAPGSVGLTCATFVMAVLRSAGVEVLLEEGWPVRSEQDAFWLQALVGFAHPNHLAALTAQVEAGVARVHPHELLAACTLTPLPVTFSQVQPTAAAVIAKLDAAKSAAP
ncbi:hypothetical protein L6R46_07655 [Myxococcota bacterium]|nr:hypothetical protein [Myxococcota bacterium]